MMRVTDAARALISAHPDKARPGSGWPCCEWVGRVLVAMGGLPHAGWWRDMCIWEPDDPWSPMRATRQMVEHATGFVVDAPGALIRPQSSTWGKPHEDAVLRSMTWGRWHVAQRWARLPTIRDPGSGHQALIRYDGDGVGVVLESSIRDGIRVNGDAWHGGRTPQLIDADLRPWIARGGAGVAVVPLWEGA